MKLGQYNNAVLDFSKSIEFLPTDAFAFKHRAKSRLHLNQLKEAESDNLKALSLEPRDADSNAVYGLICEKLKKVDIACKYWNISIEYKFIEKDLEKEIRNKITSYCKR